MKGYKALNKDLTCRGFQYEIGKTYEMDGDIEPCVKGFHFCKSVADCYSFYDMSNDTRICEVEATGNIKTNDDIKFCTDKITILPEVTEDWIKRGNTHCTSSGYCNSGDYNSGDRNSGDYNSGYCNSGDYNNGDRNSGTRNSGNYNSGYCNSGDYNSGDYNSGNQNSGDCNSGNCNSGNRNSGDYNSGDRNSGYYNSGYWNSGDYNSGTFCTKTPEMLLFDKPSGMTMYDFIETEAYAILLTCPFGCYESNSKVCEYSADDRQEWWDGLPVSKKRTIMGLPHFDMEKFRKCMQMEDEE